MTRRRHNMAKNSSKPASGHLEPPSSLHTKLQTILDQFTVKPIPNDKYYRLGQDHIIAEILQAFQEAGYYKPQVFSESAGNFMNATGGYTDIKITGPEWLNRFKAELDKEPKLEKYPKSRETTDKGGHFALGWNSCYDSLLERAKRAAGVSDE
jgi:hypothetical protein